MKFKLKHFLFKAIAGVMSFAFAFSSPISIFADDDNLKFAAENINETTIYIVGDSTACEYGNDENYAIPRAGWGMYLGSFLNDKATVVDLALGGRSSKSFLQEENYQKLKDNLKENDFLLIQFGHNDQKKSNEEDLKNRYTDPDGDKETEGSFQKYLYDYYIKLAEEKGATPILLSPVSRRKFDENGKVTDSHTTYDDAVRKLAKDTGVEFIDMTKITENLYNDLGEEGTKLFHAVYKDKTKGIDNTHFNHYGAVLIAQEVLENASDIKKYATLSTEETFINMNICTRGKFVYDIMRTIGEIDDVGNDNFNDVSNDYKYSAAIANAKKAGIVKGDTNGNFNPDSAITWFEATSITMRTLKYKNVDYPKANVSDFGEIIEFVPEFAVQDLCDALKIVELNKGEIKPFFNDVKKFVEVIASIEFLPENIDVLALVSVYNLIADKENNETVEQDLTELEKVENTK